MGLFTPRHFLLPSEWMRAIPLAQEEFKRSLPLSLENVHDHQDWFTILMLILQHEGNLRELVVSAESGEEQPLYPINMSNRHFGRLEQLLFTK